MDEVLTINGRTTRSHLLRICYVIFEGLHIPRWPRGLNYISVLQCAQHPGL